MNELLVVRPIIEGDEVTPICYDEAQEIIDYAKQKGWKVIDIAKQDAVRGKVEKAIRENPDAIICHYDHGNETSWIGSDEEPCIDLKNVDVLEGRECYAQNCSSAAKLGVEAWKINATYWGYTEVYVFTVDDEDYFKKFNNHGIKLRIDGENWSSALEKTKELGEQLVSELLAKGKAFAAACLHHDIQILVLYDKEHPPTSDCAFRRIAIKLFGPKLGWKLTWKTISGWTFFLVGFGVALHDFAHQVSELKGTPLSLEGGYVGFAIIFIGFLILVSDYVEKDGR